MQLISARQIAELLNWEQVLNCLCEAHLGARPSSDSYFIGDEEYGLFSRGVIFPGRGAGVKVASLCPANARARPAQPSEHGVFLVIDELTKAVTALLDGPAVTQCKTAADSALAARRLSREDSEVLLVLGAGPVSRSLIDAYLHIRPAIKQVLLWNRSSAKLEAVRADLQRRGIDATIVNDLNQAVTQSDIITSATSTPTPLILGRHVKPGTHIDLVGGFRPDMQEADNDLLSKARIFVDDRISAANSGDISIPLAAGVISEAQVEGDLFDLCQMDNFRRTPEQITVYKNAGGAHLDLIVSQYFMARLNAS